ncbi:MAG: hypothetical protein ACOCXG_04265 [Nanoarchaeota archaeon]
MEDDYELVPKGEIQRLREENKKLKEKLESKPEQKPQENLNLDKFLPTIIQNIHAYSQKERDMIMKELNEIKELDKNTLDNILHKNEELEAKFEGVLEMLKQVISSMTEVIEMLAGKTNEGLKPDLEEIKQKLDLAIESKDKQTDEEIDEKFANIERFMTNLRVLLSQVKPNNMSLTGGNLPPAPPKP